LKISKLYSREEIKIKQKSIRYSWNTYAKYRYLVQVHYRYFVFF